MSPRSAQLHDAPMRHPAINPTVPCCAPEVHLPAARQSRQARMDQQPFGNSSARKHSWILCVSSPPVFAIATITIGTCHRKTGMETVAFSPCLPQPHPRVLDTERRRGGRKKRGETAHLLLEEEERDDDDQEVNADCADPKLTSERAERGRQAQSLSASDASPRGDSRI